MPVRCQVDREASLATFVVEGDVVFDEIRSVLESLYKDEYFAAGSLFDMRAATSSNVKASQVRSMVGLIQQRRRHPHPARWAIVTSREVDFGLSRMFEAYTDKFPTTEVRVFRDADEARQWLALAPDGELGDS